MSFISKFTEIKIDKMIRTNGHLLTLKQKAYRIYEFLFKFHTVIGKAIYS